MELSDRKKKLLAVLIERYIATGEPVGSKALLENSDLSVSSATIRNELKELDEMGFLEQPHTSAGRVPTGKGYRYYVDHLMAQFELPQNEKNLIESKLQNVSGDSNKVLETAGSILADMTGCASVSTTPCDDAAVVRRVELVPIGSKTAMLVMITSSGIIRSRVCKLVATITPSMAESFYHIVQENFVGKPAAKMNIAKIQTLAVSLGEYALSMTPLLVALCDLAQMTEQTQMLMEGQSNLLHYKEYDRDVYKLLDFLRLEEPLYHLFSTTTKPDENEPNILIGEENCFRELQNSSMIFDSYQIGGRDSGTLGFIGPTRLDYARLIPSLKYLTKIVGNILSDSAED